MNTKLYLYTTKYKTFSSNSFLVIILLLLFLMLLLLAVVFEQKPLKDKARHKLNIHCKIWNVHCIFKQLRELQILPLLRILNPLQYPYSLNLLHMQPLITMKGCLKLNIKYIFVAISDDFHIFGNYFRLIENMQSIPISIKNWYTIVQCKLNMFFLHTIFWNTIFLAHRPVFFCLPSHFM